MHNTHHGGKSTPTVSNAMVRCKIPGIHAPIRIGHETSPNGMRRIAWN
jgi:hypothetical protein